MVQKSSKLPKESLKEKMGEDKPKETPRDKPEKKEEKKPVEIDKGKNIPVFIYCPDVAFNIKLFRDPVFEIKTCLGPMCILLFFSSGVNFFGEAADQYSNLLTF